MKFKNILADPDKDADAHSILVVDDKSENLDAARQVFTDATFASSAEEALRILEDGIDHDFVFTDLSMETPLAGLRVIRKAISTLRAPILVTNAGVDHGSQLVYIIPGGIFFSRWDCQDALSGKSNVEFWQLLRRLLTDDDIPIELARGPVYYQRNPERREHDETTFQRDKQNLLVQVSNLLLQKHLRGNKAVAGTPFLEDFTSRLVSIYVQYLTRINLVKPEDEELQSILTEKL